MRQGAFLIGFAAIEIFIFIIIVLILRLGFESKCNVVTSERKMKSYLEIKVGVEDPNELGLKRITVKSLYDPTIRSIEAPEVMIIIQIVIM